MDENWKIKVVRGISTLMAEIIVYRHLHDGKIEVLDAKGVSTPYDNGTYAVLPTFRVHEYLLPALVEALKESGTGTRTKDESKTEGKLEATERHLADLRRLLKLK